jgi:hypothetical protein
MSVNMTPQADAARWRELQALLRQRAYKRMTPEEIAEALPDLRAMQQTMAQASGLQPKRRRGWWVVGAMVGGLILAVIGAYLVVTVATAVIARTMAAAGECRWDVMVQVGGSAPHLVDECTYRANVVRMVLGSEATDGHR